MTATTIPAEPTPPDPQQDRPGNPVPANIAQILHIVRILLGYGRHLAATLEHRATVRGFSTIAQYFSSANVTVILAHLRRGIMRAVALERVLLARAARGRDLVVQAPGAPGRTRPAAQPAPQPPPPSEPAAQTAAPLRTPRAPRDEQRDPTHLPTMEQLEAEARRRPIGRLIADICQDLGVAPCLCAGGFWNDIFQALLCYRGSLVRFSGEMRRREVHFEKELDRNPALGWPEQSRDAIRRVLGFFVGETPVDPCPGLVTACVPAAALRPP